MTKEQWEQEMADHDAQESAARKALGEALVASNSTVKGTSHLPAIKAGGGWATDPAPDASHVTNADHTEVQIVEGAD